MKTLLSSALLCAMLVPSSAMAMQIDQIRNVRIYGMQVGTLSALTLESEAQKDFCRYQGIWVGPDGSDSLNLELHERISDAHADCAANALLDFDTTVEVVGPCEVYDPRGRHRNASFMILSETPQKLSGMMLIEGVPIGVMPFYVHF